LIGIRALPTRKVTTSWAISQPANLPPQGLWAKSSGVDPLHHKMLFVFQHFDFAEFKF
jgi:hypothetical protein